MDEKKKSGLYGYLFRAVVIIIICSVCYSMGFLVGRDGWQIGVDGKTPGLINVTKGQPKNADFSLFWQAWNTVSKSYVGKVDTQKMMNGAISGMMNSLGDPYTMFMSNDENSQFQDDISGHFDGIGIEVALRDNKITVVAPLDGSPAQKAGLQAQDVILAVNKKSTDTMTINDVVTAIRGKTGSEVTLSILHKDAKSPQDYKIKRDTIYVKSVTWEMKPNNVAYIKVSQFGEDTFDLFNSAIDQVKAKNPKAVVIDLRDNPGGLLDTAIKMTSLVMKPGVVVQRKYKDGHIEKDKTNLPAKLLSPKLLVLANGGSASASEIFAGAIQDSKRGIVIGEKTFGKGSVQDLTELPNGASIKVTIAKWLTPGGREIDGKGIEPDIKVEGTASDDGKTDPQLDRALTEAAK